MRPEITSRRTAEEMLVQKAAQDDAFRTQLLTNPKATISHALGIAIPAGIEIKVLEETSRTLYLVLPRSTANQELVEAELESAVGGTTAEARQLQDEAEKAADDASGHKWRG